MLNFIHILYQIFNLINLNYQTQIYVSKFMNYEISLIKFDKWNNKIYMTTWIFIKNKTIKLNNKFIKQIISNCWNKVKQNWI